MTDLTEKEVGKWQASEATRRWRDFVHCIERLIKIWDRP